MGGFGYSAKKRGREKSDPKDGERGRVFRTTGRRAAIQTPYGRIRFSKLGSSVQHYGTRLNYPQVRNNFSRSVEPFSRNAGHVARLRHQYRTYSVNTRMNHG